MRCVLVAALFTLILLPLRSFSQSEMPYAGAPCTAVGGVKASASQIARFQRFDLGLRSALKQNNVAALAFLVRFPLRVNSGKGTILIPDAESLSGHYEEVFPAQIREAVLATHDDDYLCRYDEGLAYMNGSLWVSVEKGRFAVDVINVGGPISTSSKLAPAYTCETRTHRIVVDESADGKKFRYRSWNKPKRVIGTPDLDLSNGVKSFQGTGVCAYPLYTFETGNAKYEVQGALGCTDGSEPKKATGHLSVTANGSQVTDAWCF